MKTTVNLGESRRFITQPTKGGILLSMEGRDQITGKWYEGAVFHFTPDQVGALAFGMEAATEAAMTAAQRVALSGAH